MMTVGCLSKRLSKVVETGDRFRETRCGLGWSRVRDDKNKYENNNKLLYRGAPNGGRPVWFAGRFAGSLVGAQLGRRVAR